MYSALDRINPDMVKAILQKEDQWFFYHPGVNPFSIVRAVFKNAISGKRTSGASTISMQLARMREPAARTYLNKFKEMFRALQYEWTYSKKEILEMYLSYLPYGGNVEGVYAASYIFFNRPPAKLSLSQSILLTVIPNRPNSLRLDRHKDMALAARDKWIRHFQKSNIFDIEQLEIALLEPISGRRYELSPQTPQFCYALREKYPYEREIYSSLNPEIQVRTQSLLKNHVRRLKRFGISNGAALILNNTTHQVVAYCASADFYDVDAYGQVDGIKAIRSPGSALKPAAYGLGFDLGLITPKMKLLDVPTNLAGFQPENYDYTYHGQVSVHFALSHSLNIPPVRLVESYGIDKFLDLLELGGFKTVKRKRNQLGFSSVLGGCGVTLEELTTFYGAIANEGGWHSANYLAKPVIKSSGKELFSAESAYLLANILSDIERPDLPQAYIEASNLPKVAWKTGTSYGHRDAWSIGFNPIYTVGVWMGNFDGSGVPELSGAGMAVPLMFDIFNAMDYPAKVWFEQPDGLGMREVCAETGLPSKHICERREQDLFIADKSPLQACSLYQNLFVNEDTTLTYCPVCLPSADYQLVSFPLYEAELALWYEMNHVGINVPPPHNPDCEAKLSGDGPKILSPSANFEYLIERGAEQELLLQAASEADVSKHYWYVNNAYLGQSLPGEKFFYKPTGGKLSIVCMDDKGRKSEVEVLVLTY